MLINVGVLTASDRGARGEREDTCLAVIRELVSKINGRIVVYCIVPDESAVIRQKLEEFCDTRQVDLLLTTGGTGLSSRDVTPEATLAIIEREVPGIADVMRAASIKITPRGMLSRGRSGIRGRTLVVNLPGSPKAVGECLEVILPALPHAVDLLRGDIGDCANQPMEKLEPLKNNY